MTRLVPRADWDPALCEGALSATWPLGPALAALSGSEGWPSVARLDELLSRFEVRNARGVPLRAEEQAPKVRSRRRPRGLRCRDELYDARIDGEGVLPTRARSYHDLFNALVWATFPRAKAAISARQHAIWAQTLPSFFETLPSRRTREQDALAMLDEGGLLLAAEPEACAEIEGLVETGALEELERRAEAGRVAGLVFGHAVHEHFVSSGEPVRAATFVLPVAPHAADLVGRVDAALARRVADPASFATPPARPGLPLCAASPLCVRPAALLRDAAAAPTTLGMTHELTIDGMSCGHCVMAVREALSKVPGVTRADVQLDPSKVGRAHVEGEVSREALVRAVEAEDYRVRPA